MLKQTKTWAIRRLRRCPTSNISEKLFNYVRNFAKFHTLAIAIKSIEQKRKEQFSKTKTLTLWEREIKLPRFRRSWKCCSMEDSSLRISWMVLLELWGAAEAMKRASRRLSAPILMSAIRRAARDSRSIVIATCFGGASADKLPGSNGSWAGAVACAGGCCISLFALPLSFLIEAVAVRLRGFGTNAMDYGRG